MKEKLITILEQITDDVNNELQLRKEIASRLTNLGYNGVSVVSDKYIYLGLENNLYALLSIIFIEDSIFSIKNIVREINTCIEKKSKNRYCIFVCKQNNIDRLTKLLNKIDKKLKPIYIDGNRFLLLELPFEEIEINL